MVSGEQSHLQAERIGSVLLYLLQIFWFGSSLSKGTGIEDFSEIATVWFREKNCMVLGDSRTIMVVNLHGFGRQIAWFREM
jgi:hypothetical protein